MMKLDEAVKEVEKHLPKGWFFNIMLHTGEGQGQLVRATGPESMDQCSVVPGQDGYGDLPETVHDVLVEVLVKVRSRLKEKAEEAAMGAKDAAEKAEELTQAVKTTSEFLNTVADEIEERRLEE